MENKRKWNEVLHVTARDIVPSDEDTSFANTIIDEIFRDFQSKSKYKIDRQYIAGSIGKKTAINIKPDYDCVIFVNDIKPPYEDVIADFERILEDFSKKVTFHEQPRKPRKVLQVTIEGLDIDIVPAINFSQHKVIQRKRTMERITGPRDGYLYSSCLTEDVVAFIKKQSPFVHDVIRLAKYWNKLVTVPHTISARSSIMECIAVHVGQREEKAPNKASLAVAFKDFLEMVMDFPNMCIKLSDVYDEIEIPKSISKQRPLVMDPANPYNNLAFSFLKKPEAMEMFKTAATYTALYMYSALPPSRDELFKEL